MFSYDFIFLLPKKYSWIPNIHTFFHSSHSADVFPTLTHITWMIEHIYITHFACFFQDCHDATRQHFHSSHPTQPFQSISFMFLNISISFGSDNREKKLIKNFILSLAPFLLYWLFQWKWFQKNTTKDSQKNKHICCVSLFIVLWLIFFIKVVYWLWLNTKNDANTFIAPFSLSPLQREAYFHHSTKVSRENLVTKVVLKSNYKVQCTENTTTTIMTCQDRIINSTFLYNLCGFWWMVSVV